MTINFCGKISFYNADFIVRQIATQNLPRGVTQTFLYGGVPFWP